MEKLKGKIEVLQDILIKIDGYMSSQEIIDIIRYEVLDLEYDLDRELSKYQVSLRS
jgi:hypothetical protein